MTLQQQYSLLCRNVEWDTVDVCRNEGIGILPWSPLAGGWLTGKYQRFFIQCLVGGESRIYTHELDGKISGTDMECA